CPCGPLPLEFVAGGLSSRRAMCPRLRAAAAGLSARPARHGPSPRDGGVALIVHAVRTSHRHLMGSFGLRGWRGGRRGDRGGGAGRWVGANGGDVGEVDGPLEG